MRPSQLWRPIAALSALMLVAIMSCSPSTPGNREESINQVISKGFLSPGPVPGSVLFGPGLAAVEQISESQTPCEGVIGSMLPPLSLKQCFRYSVVAPLIVLSDLQLALNGQQNPYRRHVILPGIEQSWVQQSKTNDCWAAALETSVRYLRYPYVSQSALLRSAQKVCPKLSEQEGGAEIYQVVYATKHILKQSDYRLANPIVCLTAVCVVNRLSTGHPVIMFGSGHAVVLAGADYMIIPPMQGRPEDVLIEKMYVLDPAAETRQLVTWTPLSFCKIDAFVSY